MSAYKQQVQDQYEERISQLLTELPDFCDEFIYGIASAKPSSTRYNYLCDIRVFLYYLVTHIKQLKGQTIKELPMDSLALVTPRDMDRYLSYLSNYTSIDGKQCHNSDSGKLRKIASLSSMYKFFIRRNYLKDNPTIYLERPKIQNIDKTVLTDDEVDKLLSEIESGINLTPKQLLTHPYRKYRDLSIVIMLLSTGMRVSELVGLDLTDIIFDSPKEDDEGNVVYEANVIRKGGKTDTVVFTEECMIPLVKYLHEERNTLITAAGLEPKEEPAIFISLKGGRMAPNSIEHMVRTYTKSSVPLKHITPHKFRKTRGTNLYNASGDIELVRNILGHSQIATTSKHYILDAETQKINAAAIGLSLKQTDYE